MPRVPVLSSLLLGLLCLGATSVRAQQAEAAAEALFRAGRDASQRGDTQTACDRFRESYRLEPALGTLLNIATCELSLGKLSEAWRHFQDVAHALPPEDPRVALANAKLAELDRRLARLTVTRAAGAPPELEVFLGDVQLGSASLGIALPLDPGSYTLEARAPQREPRRYALSLGEGEQRTVEVEPGPELPAPAVATVPVTASGALAPNATATPTGGNRGPRVVDRGTIGLDGRRAAGFTLLGAGALGLVASTTFAVLVVDRLDTVDEKCPRRDACTSPAGLAAADAGEVYWASLWVSAGVTLAASAAGAFLLITAADARDSHVASVASLSFVPYAAPHAAGGVVRASF